MRVFALIALATGFGSAACSNAGQSGPTAMGASGATITGAIVVEGGSARKHSGGGSASVPGLVVTVAGTNISVPVDSADQFILRQVPSGSVSLVFTAPGLNGAISLPDITDGETVDVRVTVTGSTVALDSQRRQSGSETELEGRIDALPPTTAASTMVVAGRHVTTNGDTRFLFLGDESGVFSDLEVGMRVHVRGTRSGDTMTATLVQIQSPKVDLPVNLNGIIDNFEGTASDFEFTIGDRLIEGDSATVFQGKSTFLDLADGKRVEVKGQMRNGSVYALRIHVHK